MQSCPHIAVSDFEQGVGFYTAMFGREPTVMTDDFARWHSKDSKNAFAIIARRSILEERLPRQGTDAFMKSGTIGTPAY